MKIGLVCPYNITKGGGVNEVVFAMQTELMRRGHSVKIITPLPRDKEVIDVPNAIFAGSSTDFRSPMRTTVQVSASTDIDQIDEMLAHEQFDILHFHEPWIPIISRQILQRSSSVNVATFHAKVPETLMSRTVIKVVTPYLKSVLKYLHHLTAVSDSAAEYAAGLTDDPITIIPNGIDLDKYQKTVRPKKRTGPRTILYIGRLEGRKGVKYLLQAYKLLTQEVDNIQLIIAGDGPGRERLELLAEDLQLPNVSFLGYISEELKLQLLAEADIYCSPAIYGESFGIVLLEAMATDTVIVAGNNSGYGDVMQELGAVSIVNPRDEAEFARRLKLLLENDELRALWQGWATNYVQQYNWPAVIDQYEAFYAEAIKDRNAREA
ncbi:MAG: glycosyltransferase family 4 protein [Candidatus Saccharimonadales bacterium]